MREKHESPVGGGGGGRHEFQEDNLAFRMTVLRGHAVPDLQVQARVSQRETSLSRAERVPVQQGLSLQ